MKAYTISRKIQNLNTWNPNFKFIKIKSQTKEPNYGTINPGTQNPTA